MVQVILLSEEKSFYLLPSFLGIYFYVSKSKMAVHLVVAAVGCYQNVVPLHLVVCKLLHSGDDEWLLNSEYANGPA